MAMSKRNRRPSLPGEILKTLFLEPRNITISEIAEVLGVSRKHMSQIVNGHARFDPMIAARLAKVLKTSVEVWVGLQADVDAWEAKRAARRWKPAKTLKPAA